MICFWQYVLLSRQFKLIDHKFPEPGHTYLDSDRDFGKVEAAVKKRENVYSVDQYQALMVGSQAKATVTRVGDKMIDIMKLCQSMGLKKQTLNVNREKIELRDKVRWLRISEFGRYQYKHSLNEEEQWKEVDILRHDGVREDISPTVELLPPKRVPIKPAKLNDIKKLLKFVPEIYHGLYLGLTTSGNDDHNVSNELESDEELSSVLVTVQAGSSTCSAPCINVSIRTVLFSPVVIMNLLT